MDCETCSNYEWDEEAEEYFCSADIDEDDYARMMQEERGHHARCPYWQSGDEYVVVAHQAFSHGPNPDREDAKSGARYTRVTPGKEFGGK
ncbi:hypothetical protein SAMN02745687_01523 [Lachnospiraceae bacterium NK3A20]|nr:hypothetical protein SAMN02745687_01523 [Lachnospiraceae bacterium NK3A20]